MAAGSVKAVLLVGHEVDDPEALAKIARQVDAVVHVAHASTPLAKGARVTLPSVPWVQLDGTWLNGYDRLQRLSPGFAPVGSARPSHEWLSEIASELGVALALPSVATIRLEMERTLTCFRDSRISTVGPLGHSLAG